MKTTTPRTRQIKRGILNDEDDRRAGHWSHRRGLWFINIPQTSTSFMGRRGSDNYRPRSELLQHLFTYCILASPWNITATHTYTPAVGNLPSSHICVRVSAQFTEDAFLRLGNEWWCWYLGTKRHRCSFCRSRAASWLVFVKSVDQLLTSINSLLEIDLAALTRR